MASQVYFHEAIEQILLAMQSMLEAQNVDNGLLDYVNSIVIGERARMQPETPVIWLFSSVAINDHRTMANKEKWRMPVEIVSVVQELDDTQRGYIDANKLAAQARTVVLNGRNLGLDFVSDVKSVRFTPSQQYLVDNTVKYGASATVEVSFYAVEYSLGG